MSMRDETAALLDRLTVPRESYRGGTPGVRSPSPATSGAEIGGRVRRRPTALCSYQGAPGILARATCAPLKRCILTSACTRGFVFTSIVVPAPR